MKTKFKVFVTPNGDYGVIETAGFGFGYISTSKKPEFIDETATITDIYNKWKDQLHPENLKTIMEDWKLVTVTLNLK